MDSMSGDKWHTLWSMIVAQAWRSDDFRKRLLGDPKAALKEIGVFLPVDVTVKVLENTETVSYIPLTRDLDIRGEARERFVHFFDNLIPIPEGKEIRLVQSTESTRCLVVPLKPPSMKPGELTEAELLSIAAGGETTEATVAETTEAVAAETTEAAVTETTECQDVETTTTVVSEVELVAT